MKVIKVTISMCEEELGNLLQILSGYKEMEEGLDCIYLKNVDEYRWESACVVFKKDVPPEDLDGIICELAQMPTGGK